MVGKKIPQEDVDRILRSYVITQNYARTSRELGIPESTVRKKVKENRDTQEYAKLCALKNKIFNERFISYANEVIEKAFNRLIAMLDDEKSKISAKELAIVIGTNIDKKEVLNGNSNKDGDRKGGVIVVPEVKPDD